MIVVNFSEPDQYGEIHAYIETPLDMNTEVSYLMLAINDNAPVKYRLDFRDAGTTGYSAMKGRYAVSGRLTNISIDWAAPDSQDFLIINVIGTVDNGQARLHLWKNKL